MINHQFSVTTIAVLSFMLILFSDYADGLKKLLFQLSVDEMKKMTTKYSKKTLPMSRQFEGRVEALTKRHKMKGRDTIQLHPSGKLLYA